MKIIEIKPRRKFLVGLVFDCELDPKEFGADADAAGFLSLDSELCEMKRLKAGMTLSDDELTELVRESHIKRAKSRAMWYLSRGDMAKQTLFDKLRRSFPDYACQIAADRAEELGYINDEAYAKRRLQRIIDEKRVSVRMAKQLLRQEGIDPDLADDAEEAIEYDPVEAIVGIIERKYKSKLSDRENTQKVIAAILRKGYSFSEIKEALSRFNSENDFYSEENDD